ncbi:hypothetical protein E3N88_27063 [Mikania micrantha]|uniref:Uncharacterized protein n=1 Tax=Mikania micrantha TaxID=192012 RepID=A0A5N6MYL0_9ASTR|nr:hypothetical protein E3N88_27063 [Mikania micrantha]
MTKDNDTVYGWGEGQAKENIKSIANDDQIEIAFKDQVQQIKKTNSPNNIPFAALPSGCTSAAVFTQASSPGFGASSAPAFGSSMPAFVASSSPDFGASVCGWKPACGNFGSTTQSSSIGSSFQQSQPASGSNGSSPLGSSSQPAFASLWTSAIGTSSTPAFDATSTPAFGGQTTTPWRDNASDKQVVSISAMGGLNHAAQSSGGMGFDMNNTHQTNHPFASSPAANPFSSTTSTNPFVPKNSTFGTESSTPLGSSPFGSTPTTSSYLFGAPSSSPIGSSIPIYGTQAQGITSAVGTGLNFEKLESISAMPAYKEKSHEELKWEYCQLRNKGDNHCDLAYTNTQQTNPFASSSAPVFWQSSANPFNLTISTNPFAQKTSTFGTLGSESSHPSLDSSPSTLILVFNFKTMHLT